MGSTDVYFGYWKYKPENVDELPEKYRHKFLPEMSSAVKEMKSNINRFWTNNPQWLMFFNISNIYLCISEEVILLKKHPDWGVSRDYFTQVEFATNLAHQENSRLR